MLLRNRRNLVDNKKVVILGGGTVSHVKNHLALAAPAYGETARRLSMLCMEHSEKLDVEAFLTKMALGYGRNQSPELETPEDIDKFVKEHIISDLSVKIVFFNVAIVDFNAQVVSPDIRKIGKSGKYEGRLKTGQDHYYLLELIENPKILNNIRKDRKDIFLVGFKTTCGASSQEQFLAGLNLVKKASCNLVLANDVKTRHNMVITPEEAAYHETTDRMEALRGLVEMAYLRSHLTFTRSTVISGEPVSWESNEVPESLRQVVDYCIERGAYKAFNGATVGHFAVKLNDQEFLTSRRKTNFNLLRDIGLVKIKTDGPDSVIAYGSKPSVGGQSQRIIFKEHKDYDCIVHFHCPLKKDYIDNIPVVSQREYECGSHECGQNTSRGLKSFGEFSAVYLDKHGPNIVFNQDINPEKITQFIDRNFNLHGKTGGYLV